ncbi:hypothetical protein BCV71DRAFT_236041 [Rhizopus microsporus]|uniref:Uncharacterized protein n=1 Tax=Rhizopus microsporus TaxID=58291 RepID=A0A1X0RZ27_RHIZD|nr:hypothetical protein BCV71DRAFT_236041 [Rhizopus microsporus]
MTGGYSEAKTYTATDNNMLARDLLRAAMFNKGLIDKEDIRTTIGFRITFYIVELNFRDVYILLELCNFSVSHAFELVKSTSLRCFKEKFQDNKTKSGMFTLQKNKPFVSLLITLLSDVHHLCIALCYHPAIIY